jgi:hypothetical protein
MLFGAKMVLCALAGVSVQLPPTKFDGCFRTQEFEPMTRQLRVR